MLQEKNLTKTYGEQMALNSLNLASNEGEIFAFLGIMKEGNLVSVVDASTISANELEKLYLQTV